MKKFAINISYLFLCFILLAFIFYQLNEYLFDHCKAELDSDTKTLVCGASISRNAINDQLIPGLQNVSIAGRSYMDFYLSARRFVRDNPNVETILTDFSFQSLPASRDYLFYHPKKASGSLDNIYPLLTEKHIFDYPLNYDAYIKSIFRYRITPNTDYIKNILHPFFPKTFDYHIPFQGKYTDRIEHNLDSAQLEKGIRRYFYYKGDLLDFSKVDLPYLDSLVNFCETEALNLVLFSGPLHEKAHKKAPENYMAEYHRRMNFYDQKPHINILDFSTTPLPDSCFANHNHLNYHGARVISAAVRDSLKLWYGS